MDQEQTMVVTQPQAVETGYQEPVKEAVPEISTDPMDFQKEIQKIAEEQGVVIQPDGQVVPVQQQAEPEPRAEASPQLAEDRTQAGEKPEVKVPDKFLTKDGKVDEEKVAKSTLHAEEAVKRYLEKEAELRRLTQKVNNLSKTAPQDPQPQQPTNLGAGLTADKINEALKNTNNPGQVLLELSQLTYQAAYQQALLDSRVELDQVRGQVESEQRSRELQAIAQRDPWVFSEEGIKKLFEIRQANPHINAAPEPWKAAYKEHLANEVLSQKLGLQVQMPNPTATAAPKAPPAPAGAANRVTPQPKINLEEIASDPKRLSAHLDTLSLEQQALFWKKAIPGLRH